MAPGSIDPDAPGRTAAAPGAGRGHRPDPSPQARAKPAALGFRIEATPFPLILPGAAGGGQDDPAWLIWPTAPDSDFIALSVLFRRQGNPPEAVARRGQQAARPAHHPFVDKGAPLQQCSRTPSLPLCRVRLFTFVGATTNPSLRNELRRSLSRASVYVPPNPLDQAELASSRRARRRA